jgi:hypothetical protein
MFSRGAFVVLPLAFVTACAMATRTVGDIRSIVRGDDSVTVVGDLWDTGATTAVRVLLNGSESGVDVTNRGNFVVRTTPGVAALAFITGTDTLRLPAVRLERRDTLTLELLLSPLRPRPRFVCSPNYQACLRPVPLLWVADGVPYVDPPAAIPILRVRFVRIVGGAEAASLFGSRASGGAVLITSRR